MMEQTDVPAAPDRAIVSIRLPLSDEVRASLEAVRVAQEAARVRARRQTALTRVWFAMALAVVALAAVAVGPRVARWRKARPQPATATAVPLPSTAPAPVAAPAPSPATAPSVTAAAAMPEPSSSPAIDSETPIRPAMGDSPIAAPEVREESAKSRGAAGTDQGCDTALIRSAPWRISPEACARAFEANPVDAGLALAIAHAEHVRGHFDDAAQWAKRALDLDPKTAEAHVLIARADLASGRDEEARAAYERYLALAPRGWHQREARAACAKLTSGARGGASAGAR